MKNIFTKGKTLSVILSVVFSFLLVFAVASASTTISTNINTGGTLTVSGASTLTGAATLSSTLGVSGATTLSSTLAVTGTSTFSDTATVSAGKGLVLGSSTSNLTGSAGMIFYDSTNKAIKLYDGASWFTVGTTTDGVTLSGSRVQLGDLTTQYMTFGTTTKQGFSVMTLEATTTNAIPLTIVGYTGQTADLLDLMNSGGTKLLYATSAGALFASSTLQTTGALTTYGNVTLGDAVGDVITVNGYLTQARIGTGTTFDHVATIGADELGVEGEVEFDGTAWFDGLLQASSTALFGGSVTNYGNLTFDKVATTTVSFLQAGLNFDVNTFVIDPNSNRIGVGTSSPAALFDVYSSATTTITIDSSHATRGGCLKIKNSSGSGYTYCVTNAGAMACSANSCE